MPFNQVVRVKREAIAACMKCPICDNILVEATTICECLHTFCRKCIYDKFSEEQPEYCCPVCETDLGGAPLEKLRADHSIQILRSKVFPFKKREEDAASDVPLVTLAAERKERPQSPLTGRKSEVAVEKTSQGSLEKQIKEDDNCEEDPEMLNKLNSIPGEPTSNPLPDKKTQNRDDAGEGEKKGDIKNGDYAGEGEKNDNIKNGDEAREGKKNDDTWKPLNSLVEVANRSPKTEELSGKIEQKPKDEDEKNSIDAGHSASAMPQRIHQQKAITLAESGVTPQAVLDANSARFEQKILNEVWCSLVASEEQGGNDPLPQITANYLRIKDGTMTVSFLQKYLMKKLELASPDEVEIRCFGQPVVPTLQLRSLVELWLQALSPLPKISTTVGSLAKDFVMVLGYARKVPSS